MKTADSCACLLTVLVPVGVSGQLAVQYDLHITAGSEMLLPRAINSGDRHPAGISVTAPVAPVDEEVTVVHSKNGKVVLRLYLDVRPGTLSQPREGEPVELV